VVRMRGARVVAVLATLAVGLVGASAVLASSALATARAHSLGGSSAKGELSWHGGPVLHSSRPYLIFWTPSGESIPSTSQSLIERFFTDVAADSGKSSNVFGVLRQYYDHAGFADYRRRLTLRVR
jgi:hypothetical protein